MTIPFTPLRVAIVTGVIVFASIGAPRIANYREVIGDGLAERVIGLSVPESSQSATAPLIKYTDKAGRTHYVSSADAIPERYRSTAETNPRLPKITYSDFPISDLRKPRANPDGDNNSRLPLLGQPRNTEGNGPQFMNNSSPGRLGGKGSGGGNGSDRSGHDDDDDGGDDPELAGKGGGNKGHLSFIKKWLYFARDTFNEASAHLSGAK